MHICSPSVIVTRYLAFFFPQNQHPFPLVVSELVFPQPEKKYHASMKLNKCPLRHCGKGRGPVYTTPTPTHT